MCTKSISSCKDGYTLETLDIYGIVDGQEQVNIAGVSYGFVFEAEIRRFLRRTGILLHRENRQPII
jgi:hypothetical protein